MAADVDTLTARRFADSYLEAFARHLGDPGEATLRAAYELGRQAIADELSVLDIAAVHHEALAEASDFLNPAKGDSVLDLYSGSGWTLKLWLERGSRALGVELGGEGGLPRQAGRPYEAHHRGREVAR